MSSSTEADPRTYLSEVCDLCRIDWPANRTVNIVCHGHSVPAGYFATPEVRSLESYPHLLRTALAAKFPHAVINVIVTAIGGENSESGTKRFQQDVLNLKPDVITIDYALNDRRIGLERARSAWTAMIEQSQSRGIKVVCLTPTPDLEAKLSDLADPLNQHAAQVRQFASQYHTGLADSLNAFQDFAKTGGDVATLMSQGNHPNEKGHQLVFKELMKWF